MRENKQVKRLDKLFLVIRGLSPTNPDLLLVSIIYSRNWFNEDLVKKLEKTMLTSKTLEEEESLTAVILVNFEVHRMVLTELAKVYNFPYNLMREEC